MDGTRFDELTRRIGRASRRQVTGALLAGLAGASLGQRAGRAQTPSASGGCGDFCAALFTAGADRDRCLSDSAKGQGLCAACDGDPGRACRAADGSVSCPDLSQRGELTACACTRNADCPRDGCHLGVCGPTSGHCFAVPLTNPEKGRGCVVCAGDADCGGGPCCGGRCCPAGGACKKNDAGELTCCLTCGGGANGACCDEISVDEQGNFGVELAACHPSAAGSDTRDFCCNEVFAHIDGQAICYGPVGRVS